MREAKRRGEAPRLDGDPFLDAQDGGIENLAITGNADGPRAVDEVAFDNLGKRAGWRTANIKARSGSLSDLDKAK